MTTVIINGEPATLPPAATVPHALERLALAPDARGVAVALDGEVIPRTEWCDTELHDGARVEVVTATQGG